MRTPTITKFYATLLVFGTFCLTLPTNSLAQTNWNHSLDHANITVIQNTPWGLLAGENNTTASQNTYNGLKISYDAGNIWEDYALQARGITDLAYFNGNIYASTYQVRDSLVGLFFSSDRGSTWSHIGNNFSASAVDLDSNTIYLGTYSNGLWISDNGGQTWLQKLGTGWFGPKIEMIVSSPEITIVSTSTKTYKSTDHGSTWTEITALAGMLIKTGDINLGVIFLGTRNTDGLYKSTDNGITWNKVAFMGNTKIGSILFYKGVYYVGALDQASQKFTVFSSKDFGASWENTGLDLVYANTTNLSSTWLYGIPNQLFITSLETGIYKYSIPEHKTEVFSFLDVPWQYTKQNELIDRVYSFFDHEYPFLGYYNYREPTQYSDTTLNFLGKRAPKPEMFYSSHDGIDFSLPYGTTITAPASGTASYYFCGDCGYTIKINHQNGYQTTYMHLQKNGLVTTGSDLWVEKGTPIGKVGMTGNTTGPHLHFSVLHDKNNDGDFADNYVDGRVDPFGWLTNGKTDPWEILNWNDSAGAHSGESSKYLWTAAIPSFTDFISRYSDNPVVTIDNKQIDFSQINDLPPSNIHAISYAKPFLNPIQKYLKYIPQTSLSVELTDTMENEIELLTGTLTVLFNISEVILENVAPNTLQVYFWDELESIWKPLETIYNELTNTLSAQTSHLSQFAVFGTKANSIYPETALNLSGNRVNDWFTEYPTVYFEYLNKPVSDIRNTFYKTTDDDSWQEYTNPFLLETDGITSLSFRSEDIWGNLEDVQTAVIKIDTQNKWKDRVKVKNNNFLTN
ncbi:hypothetical protein A2619_01925 [candidate division WWE3 bacterium RIFOXYD1_FULL_39_9]|uniref:M23ase beta-sheet core domain-containing protein n=1 Tax=candidate division WWE3 bacterium RIFOXYD1_FULL_39_9 TaxID=1802649 RepID=A0A1F4X798_UNCKA|nr:MAG: hypothetical protein A2619_01925 [candidate division WWE3 bacterium RIFOXYD1_FULL_39_9]